MLRHCSTRLVRSTRPRGPELLFDLVDALVARAPGVDRWKIHSLMPPRGFGFLTRYGVATVDPTECRVALTDRLEDGRARLSVACPGYSLEAADDFACAMRLALTNALGERDYSS